MSTVGKLPHPVTVRRPTVRASYSDEAACRTQPFRNNPQSRAVATIALVANADLRGKLTASYGELEISRAVGEGITFGRQDTNSNVDLQMAADPALHAKAGRIEADHHFCRLTNTGRWLSLWVVEMLSGRSGPAFEVRCGQSRIVPFPRARIEIHTHNTAQDSPHRILITFSYEPEASQAGTMEETGTERPQPPDYDKAGFFRVLVALCEPSILDARNVSVPTARQIARRLQQAGHPDDANLTEDAVERRLKYARQLFAPETHWDPNASRLLIQSVIQNQTVSPEHLALLG